MYCIHCSLRWGWSETCGDDWGGNPTVQGLVGIRVISRSHAALHASAVICSAWHMLCFLQSREVVRVVTCVGYVLSILPLSDIMTYLTSLLAPHLNQLQQLATAEVRCRCSAYMMWISIWRVISFVKLSGNYLRQSRRQMRLPVFVCLSVCLLARLLRNACIDLDNMCHVDRCRDMDELINFWARSRL